MDCQYPRMARSQTITVPGVALVVLVLWQSHCFGMEMPRLCHTLRTESCHHNQSRLCGWGNNTVSCDHQLHHNEVLMSSLASSQCQMNVFTKDCGFLQPSRVYTGAKPLVEMRLYHYRTWFAQRAIVNFTFPSPDWNDLKFQYKLNSTKGPYCCEFSLREVILPLNDTLVYDCLVLDAPGEAVWDAEVGVVNDRGDGKTYTFRLPSQSNIIPRVTSLQNWHVFFYLDQDSIATSHLSVTVQSDFQQVSYKVSLVKCLDPESSECGHYSVLHSELVEHPTEDSWTVSLPVWSNPGGYAVTVQIVSDQCPPETGCFVSMSPRFDIQPSLLGVWITIGMAFLLIAFLTFLLIFNHRLQTNQRILKAVRRVQPSVLLVYLPETQQHLDFINLFAEFLKDSCYLLPYFVDQDVGLQDPNCWTRENINKADKVLLIVPGRPETESITPVRNQWMVALSYLSGHHFTVHQVTRKVAVVILPSSGSVPSEVLHTSHFKLVDEIGPLVTWLHNGTWLDEVFLWRPHIKSSTNKTLLSWSDVRNAAMKTSLPSEIPSAKHNNSIHYKNIFTSDISHQVNYLRDDESIHSEDSIITKSVSQLSVSVFDPDIPSIDKLPTKVNDNTSSMSDQMSDDVSECEDDIFT